MTVVASVRCAAVSASTVGDQVVGLERDASTCGDFREFDARAQAVLDEVAASSVDVLATSRRVTLARKRCAQNVVESLLSRREKEGAEAAQQQLDALALRYSEKTFRELLGALGDDPNVSTMAALAVATANTTHRQRQHVAGDDAALSGWKVEAPEAATAHVAAPVAGPGTEDETRRATVRSCEAKNADAVLACLRELHDHGFSSDELRDVAVAASARKRETLRLLPAAQQAPALGKWQQAFRELGVDDPGLTTALEAARSARWPDIDEAVRAGDFERAAAWAEPFRWLPKSTAGAERIRQLAAQHQADLARRAAGTPLAARLHASWAERFGGRSDVTTDAQKVEFDVSRFECTRPAPPAPAGAAHLPSRLVARCTRAKRDSDSAKLGPTDANMKTFDEERSLEWENVDGTLFVTCVNRVLSYRVMSRELAVDSGTSSSVLRDDPGLGTAPQSALQVELAKIFGRARRDCQDVVRPLVERDCAALNLAAEVDFALEERFALHARLLDGWPPCFVSWLDAKWGVAPPPLPPVGSPAAR